MYIKMDEMFFLKNKFLVFKHEALMEKSGQLHRVEAIL